jgi:aquaporin Z
MATKSKTSTKRTTKTVPAKADKIESPIVNKAAGSSVKTRVTTERQASFVDRLRKPVYKPKTAVGALLAELVGTFVLAAIWLNVSGTAIALLFVLTALTIAGYALSGAHFNPAISFGAWATKQISAARMLGYMVAQFLGAMLAILVVKALLPIQPTQQNFLGAASDPDLYTIANVTEGKELLIFMAQLLGTAVFAYLFASTFNKDQVVRGLTVGFGFYAGLILAGTFAVINPAVALTVGALRWEVWPLAIYIVAPLIGAAVGMALYRLFQSDVNSLDRKV